MCLKTQRSATGYKSLDGVGSTDIADATAKGKAMSMEQIMVYALENNQQVFAPPSNFAIVCLNSLTTYPTTVNSNKR
ncbi:MAG: hypothetical protein AAF614_38835 [Chloroflexota bacterium]